MNTFQTPQPPDATDTLRGLVSLIAQTFAGVKTFANKIIAQSGLEAPGQVITAGGVVATSLTAPTGTTLGLESTDTTPIELRFAGDYKSRVMPSGAYSQRSFFTSGTNADLHGVTESKGRVQFYTGDARTYIANHEFTGEDVFVVSVDDPFIGDVSGVAPFITWKVVNLGKWWALEVRLTDAGGNDETPASAGPTFTWAKVA